MTRRLLSILLVIISILCLFSCRHQDSSFSIQFIDVGQGDSALIECDGHYMLIDGGPKSAGEKVKNVLEEKGIRKLDILAISHWHDDHYGGLIEVLQYINKVRVALCNIDYVQSKDFADFEHELSLVKTGKKTIKVPYIGDKYRLGSAEVEVVDVASKENNDSLVLLVTYGKTRFLFTGDIEYSGQKSLIDKYHNDSDEAFEVDLIKMPHHGSYSSTTVGTTSSLVSFLRTFMPKYVVISVGSGNRYGHPHNETLENLEQQGAKVYRTDRNGDIIVKSDGKRLSFETNKGA